MAGGKGRKKSQPQYAILDIHVLLPSYFRCGRGRASQRSFRISRTSRWRATFRNKCAGGREILPNFALLRLPPLPSIHIWYRAAARGRDLPKKKVSPRGPPFDGKAKKPQPRRATIEEKTRRSRSDSILPRRTNSTESARGGLATYARLNFKLQRLGEITKGRRPGKRW